MKLDSSFLSITYQETSINFSTKTHSNKKLSAKDISDSYLAQYQIKISQNTQLQLNKQIDVFTLKDIGYNGKSIGKLTQNEAKDLVSEDGFFGIKQTSQRIADFILNGAGDDIEMLKAGKKGAIEGFNEAQRLWGGELPDISQQTMKKAMEIIDSKLRELGASSIDTSA